MNKLIEQAQRMARIELGAWGEKCADLYLREHSYRILDRNWRGRGGELDLIAYDPERHAVVAVEVKTRRAYSNNTIATGTPEEAVTPVKVARLRSLLAQWVAQMKPSCEAIALDVIGVTVQGEYFRVNHVKDLQ